MLVLKILGNVLSVTKTVIDICSLVTKISHPFAKKLTFIAKCYICLPQNIHVLLLIFYCKKKSQNM